MANLTPNYMHEIRRYIRINHDRHDGEITDLIEAARADLMQVGILTAKAQDEGDPLIKRAIVCYVKANFGLDNSDAERYDASYQSLKRHLALSNEYTKEA